MEFLKGDFVRLPAEAGGDLGRVSEDSGGGKVRVQFPSGERVFRLDLCAITKVESSAETAALADCMTVKHPRKLGFVSFSAKTLEELIQAFRREFPEGFQDQHYLIDERGPQLTAHQQMVGQLSQAHFKTFMDASQFKEITQHALAVIDATEMLSHFEAAGLKKALTGDLPQRAFGEALYGLLYGEGEPEARFNAFVETLKTMNSAKWPIATYFPFMAEPTKHLVLKPVASKAVAALAGVDLQYAVLPNWKTYEQLLVLGQKLFDSLTQAGLKPADMMDVQGFLSIASRLDKKVKD